MANMDVQTGGTFDYRTRQLSGGKSYGLSQINGVKREAYDNFLKKNSLEDSLRSQVAFINYTINGNDKGTVGHGNISKIKKSF